MLVFAIEVYFNVHLAILTCQPCKFVSQRLADEMKKITGIIVREGLGVELTNFCSNPLPHKSLSRGYSLLIDLSCTKTHLVREYNGT